jgi:O-antigen/teichoic acid export membrane protein
MSLKKNTIWSLVGSITPMLLGLVTIPYLIRQIHIEAFGILTLVWSLIGYFSVFDFGIGRALTHQVSSNLSNGEASQLPRLVKTGLLIMLGTGIIGGLLLAIFSHELGIKWLNVSKSLESDTIKCLLIAALGIPLTTITSGLKGVLEGYEDFKTTSILRIILGISNFGLPVLTVMFIDHSLEYMVFSLVLARLIITIAHLVAINVKIPISSIVFSSLSTKSETKSLLSFGAWMTISNLISPLMVTADRFIISYLLGASVVAFYTVPFDFIVRLLVIPAALTGALFPRFTYLFQNNKEEVGRIYKKSFYTIFIIMLLICLAICFGSFFGLSIWINKDFAKHAWSVASILSVGLLFNSLAQIPYAAIQAHGEINITSLIHVVEFVLYVPLLYFSLQYYGLNGAAVVWSFRVFSDYIILNYFAKKRII